MCSRLLRFEESPAYAPSGKAARGVGARPNEAPQDALQPARLKVAVFSEQKRSAGPNNKNR